MVKLPMVKIFILNGLKWDNWKYIVFLDKKEIKLSARDSIEVNDEETAVILSFLYHIAKIHNRKMVLEDVEILKEKPNKSNSRFV